MGREMRDGRGFQMSHWARGTRDIRDVREERQGHVVDVPRRQQIPGEQITSHPPVPSPRSLDHQCSAPRALTLGCSCCDLTGPASPPSTFTKWGKGMSSNLRMSPGDSVQADGKVWIPSLVPGLPSRGCSPGRGCVQLHMPAYCAPSTPPWNGPRPIWTC